MMLHQLMVGLLCFALYFTLSQSDKPSGLSQGIYCEGCAATVKELLKKVNDKTGESREVKVLEAMEDICNLQNFRAYEYSPPKTGQACKHLIENYDEEIENILVEQKDVDFEQKICFELTKACEGVDRTKKEKEELEVNINDKKQKVQSGNGPEHFHVNINEEGAAEKLVNQINMAVGEKKKSKNVDGDGKADDESDEEDDEEDAETLIVQAKNQKTEL